MSAGAKDGPMVQVVVVDDHPLVRDGLITILAQEPDLEVVGEAASGPEAVVVSGRLAPDVVVMDLRMPGGDGVSAIRQLVGHDPRPRILVLTTYDTDRDILAAIGAGADGYLLKDAPRTDLVRAVRDIAAGRPVLVPRALDVLAGRGAQEALTPRELEVLRVVATGGTARAAADQLMVSEATVKTHLSHAYAKLGAGDRVAAVRAAYELGLL